MIKGMLIEVQDNVVVVLGDVKKGDIVKYIMDGKEKTVQALDDIEIYHKISINDIKQGKPVIKYNQQIGIATIDIKTGNHVHCHNITSTREALNN